MTVLARICGDNLIAGILNRNGLKTGRGNRWIRERVTALRSHHGIICFSGERRQAEGWMNLTEAAVFLGLGPKTVLLAVERGEISAEHPLPDGPWIFQKCALEKEGVLVPSTGQRPRLVAGWNRLVGLPDEGERLGTSVVAIGRSSTLPAVGWKFTNR